MQELCGRELVSSHKTVLAETNKGANGEINTKSDVKNRQIPQELSPLFSISLQSSLVKPAMLVSTKN